MQKSARTAYLHIVVLVSIGLPTDKQQHNANGNT